MCLGGSYIENGLRCSLLSTYRKSYGGVNWLFNLLKIDGGVFGYNIVNIVYVGAQIGTQTEAEWLLAG